MRVFGVALLFYLTIILLNALWQAEVSLRETITLLSL